jgi:hypothetical protein
MVKYSTVYILYPLKVVIKADYIATWKTLPQKKTFKKRNTTTVAVALA